MTLTVTSAEELKKAMEEPEAYRSLRVRMGGWKTACEPPKNMIQSLSSA